ncbi:MAG: Gfo/Idh/MocA family oxidoreductase [Thermoguttaceae bacterium]|jgi:predicted dehydrogenase
MIRVGIVGIGFMGMIHYTAYGRLRGVKVRAICEEDPQRRAGDWRTIKGNFGPQGQQMDLKGIAAYARLDEMLADEQLDLIDICLPTRLHAEAAIAALRAGKHVFCEKPIALQPADARRMVAAARQANRLLMIGHVLPFVPEYRFAYETISSGKYGKLLGGHFQRIIADPPWLPHFYDPAVIGGPMLDLHVHDAHFIRLLCGMPRLVQSAGTMRGSVVERFHTQFFFPDPGLIVTAASGTIGQQARSFTHGYEIYLEQATLLFEFAVLDDQPVTLLPVTVLPAKGKSLRPKIRAGDPVDGFVAELGAVTRAVRDGVSPPLLSGELACDAVILCHKQTQSVARGRAVKV